MRHSCHASCPYCYRWLCEAPVAEMFRLLDLSAAILLSILDAAIADTTTATGSERLDKFKALTKSGIRMRLV